MNRKKEDKKEAQKTKNVLLKEKKELSEKPDITLSGRAGDEIKRNREERIKEIDAEIEKLDEQIAEGKEVEEKERDDKFMSKLDDIDKKSESKGGDENK